MKYDVNLFQELNILERKFQTDIKFKSKGDFSICSYFSQTGYAEFVGILWLARELCTRKCC